MLLEITGLNHQGEGVGRFEGKVYFVPFTVPGDIVEVLPGKQARRFGYARMLELIRPSPDRVQPACPHMERCGGSNLHHIAYAAQLEFKRKLVTDALERIGNLRGIKVLPAIGMEHPYHYRNKAEYHVQTDPTGIGFFSGSSHTVAPVNDCLLVPREWGAIISFLEDELAGMGETVREVSELVLRQSHHTGEIMMVLEGKHRALTGAPWERLAGQIMREFTQICSVASAGRKGEVRILTGQNFLTEQLAGLTFNISPTAFFQVNTAMAEVLVGKVLEYGNPQPGDQVIDAYCGIGTISLPLARHAERVTGIELNPSSVTDARQNASFNHIENAEFLKGDFDKVLTCITPSSKVIDLLVVDPPRKGLNPGVLQSIAKLRPTRLVYVSCHPGTLARDLSFLVGEGYLVQEAQPLDLFPHTPHVECVIMMTNSGYKDK